MSQNHSLNVGLPALASLLLALPCVGALIPIDNHSFENAAGWWAHSTAPSSWVEGPQTVGAGSPAPYAIAGVETTNFSGIDGNNYLRVLNILDAPPTLFTATSWINSVSLGTFAADTKYTLTVAMADDYGDGGRSSFIALASGTTLPATAGQLITPASSLSTTFTDYSVVVDTSITLSVVGQPIHVFLGQVATDDYYGYSSYFDNVRLSTAVPEPSFYAALAGLLVLFVTIYRRR